MAKVEIYNTKEEKIFEGPYEYIEGGIEKNGKPSFHIEVTPFWQVFMTFEDIDEFNAFLKSLQEQILKKGSNFKKQNK